MTPWHATRALSAAVVGAGAALALAVVVRRPDLVALGVPMLAVLVRQVTRRADAPPAPVRITVPAAAVSEGEDIPVTVAVPDEPGVDLVQIAIPHDRGVAFRDGAALLCVEPGSELELPVHAARWGRSRIGPVTVTQVAAGGLLARSAVAPDVAGLATVLPARLGVDAAAAPSRPAGLVGAHRTRRPGSGSDLYAVREFAAGDRLRRIRWPVSLRTGRLYVTSVEDERNADVVLVVDTRVDLDAATPGAASSLDVTVRAAAAVSEHYLAQGDSVGLLDLGTSRRGVRLGGGRRQRLTVLAGLLDAGAVRTPPDARTHDRRLDEIRGSALVVVFSTLIDEQIAGRVAALAAGGRAVVVIDTLPADAEPTFPTEIRELAWRIALLRREALIHRLREVGVPVVAWGSSGGLSAVLDGVSRGSRAARVRR